jgi:hypothetical protein
MRKKIIFLSLVFILSASMVFAQEGISKDDNAGNSKLIQGNKGNNQNQEQTQQQDEEYDSETIGEQVRQQVKAVNMAQLKEMIKNKKQEMNQEFQAMKDKKRQEVYKNQNKVKEAVHALLAAEDLAGGIGYKVSEIAREFNNSVEKTIQAEEKIQKRNRIVAFFFGGDEKAAENILRETNKNKEKVKNLKKLKQECDCDEEVENVIQEQIQNIEQEQNRLGQLAQKEKSKKGLFGWLFGWMKK